MLNYLIKRLLLIIPTLLGITFITFLIIKLAPSDPLSLKMSFGEGSKIQTLNPKMLAELRKLYGLDTEVPPKIKSLLIKMDQFLFSKKDDADKSKLRTNAEWVVTTSIQYKQWLLRLLKLDFGSSLKDHRPVLEKIKEALPTTLTLNVLEVLISYFIAIPLGVYSALKRGSFFDQLLMFILFVLYSLPVFWVATLLILFFSSGDYFDLFPSIGLLSEGAEQLGFFAKLSNIAWHLTLPVICMVYGSFAFLSRYTRSNMLEVIHQDYIRSAKAKGLSFHKVIWKHAFKNTLIPLLSLMGTLLPGLLAGSIVIEQIFSIPGMGKLGFEAVLSRDYPTIMGIASIQAFLTLISLLITDLLYAVVDPRIRLETAQRL